MADLNIATLSGDYAAIGEAAVKDFRGSLYGETLLPGDDGYDGARRIWNAMIDKRPAMIARCSGTADVINSVNFARENNLLISVRGGGHNFPGNSVCNDGLMIDLSGMTGVRVDPVAKTVRAQGGTKWGAFDHETQAFGLATTGGTDVDTGIAGLTLGGGIGWLSGSCGLSCDNLIAADVVAADGRAITASAGENPDLLWGLRGGGGNFGVVTSLEYQLHSIGMEVLAGWLIFPFDNVREFFPRVNDFTDNMPDEMNLITFLHTLPDGGGKACSILLCYHGSVEDGERAIQPLRDIGAPLVDDVRPMSYTEAQKLAVAPAGRQNYLKSHFVSAVSDDIVDIALGYFDRITSPLSSILFQYLGNAARRVPAGDTAFGQRHALTEWATNAVFMDPGESEVHIRWAREFATDLLPYSSGAYINQVGTEEEEGAEAIQAAFGDNFHRLAALKQKYDPTNLFSHNQNIRPRV